MSGMRLSVAFNAARGPLTTAAPPPPPFCPSSHAPRTATALTRSAFVPWPGGGGGTSWTSAPAPRGQDVTVAGGRAPVSELRMRHPLATPAGVTSGGLEGRVISLGVADSVAMVDMAGVRGRACVLTRVEERDCGNGRRGSGKGDVSSPSPLSFFLFFFLGRLWPHASLRTSRELPVLCACVWSSRACLFTSALAPAPALLSPFPHTHAACCCRRHRRRLPLSLLLLHRRAGLLLAVDSGGHGTAHPMHGRAQCRACSRPDPRCLFN